MRELTNTCDGMKRYTDYAFQEENLTQKVKAFSFGNVEPKFLRNFDDCTKFSNWAKRRGQSSLVERENYYFCKSLCAPIQTMPKLLVKERYCPEIFTTSINWFISCGKNKSHTPPHYDPLRTSRGFLGVVKGGYKVFFYWNLLVEEDKEREIHRLASDTMFATLPENWDEAQKSFNRFNQKNKIRGQILRINPGEAIVFQATQLHAVINFCEPDEYVVGIATELWKSQQTHELSEEIRQLSIIENEEDRNDDSGKTSKWMLTNYEKVEEERRKKNKTKDIGRNVRKFSRNPDDKYTFPHHNV